MYELFIASHGVSLLLFVVGIMYSLLGAYQSFANITAIRSKSEYTTTNDLFHQGLVKIGIASIIEVLLTALS